MKLIGTWGNTNQLLPAPANTNLSQMGRDFSFPLLTCKMSLLVLRIRGRRKNQKTFISGKRYKQTNCT